MRTLLILLSVLVVVCLGSASPINPKRWLINRPTEDPYPRSRRSPQGIKGGQPVTGRVSLTRDAPAPHLRKGEYLCGNRVCKLKPGEVPKGCKGVCQYPIA